MLLCLVGVLRVFLLLLVCGQKELDEQNQEAQVEGTIEDQGLCASTPPFISLPYKLVPEERW